MNLHTETREITVIFPTDLLTALRTAVPPRQRSKAITEAVRRYLQAPEPPASPPATTVPARPAARAVKG